MATELKFNCTDTDYAIIQAIARRAVDLYVSFDMDPPPLVRLEMDLACVHLNGCPLKLQELLDSKTADFSHDIGGINNELDRETGSLGCFLPRYAA